MHVRDVATLFEVISHSVDRVRVPYYVAKLSLAPPASSLPTPQPLGHLAPTMSLKYGLNLKKAAPPKRKTILDDEPDEDEEDDNVLQKGVAEEAIDSFGAAPAKPGLNVPSRSKPLPKAKPGLPPKPPSKRLNVDDEDSRQDASAMAASKSAVKAAEELDATIFDYDSFHDAKSTVKEATRQDAIDRKPKYINNLLDAAARRKQDQQIAREKQLQRERENEGEEFADKEKFVTGAYKQQQEETRKLEEEEKKRAEEEEKRKRQMGGGMQSFYRNMMDQSEKLHQDEIDAAMKLEREGGVKKIDEEKKASDAEIAAALRAKGINVQVNEEGAIADKRDLLNAGLNVIPTGKSGDGSRNADHLRANRPAQSAFPRKDVGSREAQRERQSRMVEEQLEAAAKRKREEDDEQREKEERALKSKKTEKDVGDAKARYLARKAAKEQAQG
jgi:coiled-coil domain-containing protein 55